MVLCVGVVAITCACLSVYCLVVGCLVLSCFVIWTIWRNMSIFTALVALHFCHIFCVEAHSCSLRLLGVLLPIPRLQLISFLCVLWVIVLIFQIFIVQRFFNGTISNPVHPFQVAISKESFLCQFLQLLLFLITLVADIPMFLLHY